MADTITMTHKQLQRLLTRFKAEVDASGGEMSEAETEEVAKRLLEDLDGTCKVSGTERLMNSNVNIRVG
jgi:hypothetical protein